MREPARTPASTERTVVPTRRRAPAARGPLGAAGLIGLQRAAGNAAVGALLAPAAAPPKIQRVAAQLGVDADGATIGGLTIRGRPDSPYKGTMGDHTTAYIVQVTAVRNAIVGKSVAGALAGMNALVLQLANLPGLARSAHLARDTAGGGHGDRLDAAKDTMDALAAKLNKVGDKNARSMTLLQSLVTAYLEYRELIPLTTLNIREISPGLAGRGKGESGPARVLAGHAHVARKDLQDAVTKLLDTGGVALLATETRETAAKVAPGADLGNRVDPILIQHVRAIEAAYPGAVKRAWGGEAAAVVALQAVVAPLVDERKKENVRVYNERLLAEYAKLAALGYEDVVSSKRTRVLAREREKAAEERAKGKEPVKGEEEEEETGSRAEPEPKLTPRQAVQRDIDHMKAVVRANGGEPVTEPVISGRGGRSRNAPAKFDPAAAVAVTPSKKRKRETDPQDGEADTAEDIEAQGVGSPSATQLTVGKNGRILEVGTEGRPPSPFDSGRMGAHTTAWLVHKDIIRTALLGCTIPEAVAKLPVLGRDVDAMATRLAGFGGTATRPLAPVMAERAREATAASVPVQPLLVQEAVNTLLAHVNMLPGVAFDTVDTGGDTEGAHRAVLLKHERKGNKSREELRTRILGLLDIHSVKNVRKRETLVANHLILVAAAYPRSYATSGFAGMTSGAVQALVVDKTERPSKRGRGAAGED
ncbi:hypothetical protein AB0I28_21640 [Phytomonospora sp. NPDC050363]|uniref:hypothetical protein n=1 Tax=Phytomonospora sp. NPDC050363 TaxID=3155642 RepID=UPI0033E09C58